MSKLLLPLHLTFIGLWLGCVLTEALFERALVGQGRDKELLLASLLEPEKLDFAGFTPNSAVNKALLPPPKSSSPLKPMREEDWLPAAAMTDLDVVVVVAAVLVRSVCK